MTSIKCIVSAAAVLAALAMAAPVAAQTTVVTFDNGWEGWSGPGGTGGATTIEAAGGNPGMHAHTVFNDFGITFRTTSNPAFIGDFTQDGTVSAGIDIKVDAIAFDGVPVSRNLLVDFRSHALAQGGYPWTSVWHTLTLMQAGPDWATYAVTFTPGSQDMPAGWGGYGAEDPVTAEPMLPPGVTFADVMAQVDELAFTTLEPGYFYGFTDFDVRVDNIRIERASDAIFADGFD
ncbi:MAG: hypothetical protein ACHP7D_00380 [Lysobacterales bacterium]